MKRPELLAPAGDLEKLKMAIIYGADAVYLAGSEFGLRAAAGNFNIEDMKTGIDFAHEKGKKVYITANIIPHNNDLENLPEYATRLYELGADAIIVADPGAFSVIKEAVPKMEIHISTQANNTNYKTIEFWHKLGAKRVVIARELSFTEIKEIREKTPTNVELEAFIHGAMCVSYSGRCLLSNYMINRDANRGECAQPCRWKYYLMEEKRPNEFFPVFEDERGTHIFNSKDLCMIEHIPELVKSGISSLKIEGRVKSSYYVAIVIKAYRNAIDSYFENPEKYVLDDYIRDELEKVSHREYTKGFFFGWAKEQAQIYHTSAYIREYDIVGMVRAYNNDTKIATIEQRNRFFLGDEVEFVRPDKPFFKQIINEMKNEQGDDIRSAPHPQMTLMIPVQFPVIPNTLIRKKKDV